MSAESLETTTLKPGPPVQQGFLQGFLRWLNYHRVMVALVVVTLSTAVFPPFMRLMGPQRYTILGISEEQWSLYVASRGLIFILFVLAAGVLGDLLGRRRTLLLGLAVFIFGTLFLVFRSPVVASYLVVYTLLATLVVMINILVVTLVILSYAGRAQVLALVAYSILAGLGFLLAPILTRAIGQQVGVNGLFVLPLLLAGLGFYLAHRNVSEHLPEPRAHRQDAVALAVWTAGLCLLLYSGVLSGSLGWTSPLVLAGAALGGVILLVLYWLRGLRLPRSLRFTLVNGRELSVAIFAGTVLYLAFYAITVQMFNFLSRVMQYNLAIASLAMAPVLIGALVQNTAFSRWTDRLGMRQAMAGGLGLVAVPALALSLLERNVSYWILLPGLLLLGFGFILCNSSRLLLLSASAPKNLAATVQSIGGATANLGGALAYSFMMTLVVGFGLNAYVQTLESFGLSQEFITSRLFRLAEFGEQISVVVSPEERTASLLEIDYWLGQAYITGLSRAMLVLGIVCLFSAAVVYIGLRDSTQGGRSREEEL